MNLPLFLFFVCFSFYNFTKIQQNTQSDWTSSKANSSIHLGTLDTVYWSVANWSISWYNARESNAGIRHAIPDTGHRDTDIPSMRHRRAFDRCRRNHHWSPISTPLHHWILSFEYASERNMKFSRVFFTNHSSLIIQKKAKILCRSLIQENEKNYISLFTSDHKFHLTKIKKEKEKNKCAFRDSKQTIQNKVSTSLKEKTNPLNKAHTHTHTSEICTEKKTSPLSLVFQRIFFDWLNTRQWLIKENMRRTFI